MNVKTDYAIVQLNENEHAIVAKGRLQELGVWMDSKKIKTLMVASPHHMIEMKVKHPLFPDWVLPVIPHKYCPYGTGTGFIPVSPAHNEGDFEMAEHFNLNTKGFV